MLNAEELLFLAALYARVAIAVLRAAVSDVLKYIRQKAVQQTPGVSFLDEMLASLEQKHDAVTPVTVPRSVLEALSSDG
jgi:hypothetical protein